MAPRRKPVFDEVVRALAEKRRDEDISKALDTAQLALSEYYSGDREWAEKWLLAAYDASRK